MMRRYLYLSDHNDFLAARWLEEQPANVSVWLFHAPGMAEQARQLREAFPMVEAVRSLEDLSQDRLDFSKADAPRIALPLMPEEFPLRYQFPVRVPDYRFQARLLSRLWALGFREIETCHPGGTRILPLTHQLHEFAGLHKGRRCFIIGNGPSLNCIDMSRLGDEISFSANRGYLGFEAWGFAATYWGVYDPLQIEMYGKEYEQNAPQDIIKFFPLEYWGFLRMTEGCPVLFDWPREASRQFSDSPDRLFVGYSVTYMLLQIAAIMGCNPIVLVGMDHRYHLPKQFNLMRLARLAGRRLARRHDSRLWYRCGLAAYREYFKLRGQCAPPPSSRLWHAGEAQADTHFDARYTSERRQFLMPRPQDSEADYRCARQWAEANGVEILNATPNSALTVFPMVPFESLF